MPGSVLGVYASQLHSVTRIILNFEENNVDTIADTGNWNQPISLLGTNKVSLSSTVFKWGSKSVYFLGHAFVRMLSPVIPESADFFIRGWFCMSPTELGTFSCMISAPEFRLAHGGGH